MITAAVAAPVELDATRYERVAEWVKALESGQFAQWKCLLRKNDGCFCVLGVGCEVFRLETGHGGWDGSHFVLEVEEDHEEGEDTHFTMIREASKLPAHVARWFFGDALELQDARNPLVLASPTFALSLSACNDCRGESFQEIASSLRARFL